jgi:3D (Asp-Asp-Asp) domain-containing protein
MVTKKLNSNAPKNNCLTKIIWCGMVVFLYGLFMAFMATWFVFAMGGCEEITEEAVETDVVPQIPTEPEPNEIVEVIPEEPVEAVEVIEPIDSIEVIEDEKEYLAEFRITAYCSCKKCCGKWADNRPNGIVYGASGAELKAGVSVASFLPFGTEIYIDGLGEYVVQDRPAEWVFDKYGKNVVDVYFDNHEEACKFGLKYLDVWRVLE